MLSFGRHLMIESLEPRRLLDGLPDVTGDELFCPGVIIDQDNSVHQDPWMIEPPLEIAMNEGSQFVHSFDSTIGGVLTAFVGELPPAEYQGMIHWGDGSESDAVIEVEPDGSYGVVGSHEFLTAGPFEISIDLFDSEGASGYHWFYALPNAAHMAFIDSPDAGWVHWISSPGGGEQTVYLGNVYDVAATDPSQYTVQMDWGDGTASSGQLAYAGDGTFDVLGDHRYGNEGTYEIALAIARNSDPHAGLTAHQRAAVWAENETQPLPPVTVLIALDADDRDWVYRGGIAGSPLQSGATDPAPTAASAPLQTKPAAMSTGPGRVSIFAGLFMDAEPGRELDDRAVDPQT